jgi:hypothetical protein
MEPACRRDPPPPPSTLPEPPRIVDIEASGFGRGSYPIEVGYALPDGTSHAMLVRPEAHWTHWDPEAERLHGISRETLLRHGLPAAEVVQTLNSELCGTTAYSDGWARDYTWLAVLYDAVQRVPTFRLENLHALLSEEEAARWDRTKEQLLRELGLHRHRAANDARLLQATFLCVRAQTLARCSAERAGVCAGSTGRVAEIDKIGTPRASTIDG